MKNNQGQSLIETVVAIFILTTGLSSGLALAIFGFGASSETSDKIIATGLAREGIEAVRRMRDSNWMVASQNSQLSSCPELGSLQVCYPTWLTEPYPITGQTGAGIEYRLSFDPNSPASKWSLDSANATSDYRLYAQAQGGLSHLLSLNSVPTKFFRKINLVYLETAAPYSATSPLLLVQAVVWWHGKRCPTITYLNNLSDTTCKLISEEYLTNWRNY